MDFRIGYRRRLRTHVRLRRRRQLVRVLLGAAASVTALVMATSWDEHAAPAARPAQATAAAMTTTMTATMTATVATASAPLRRIYPYSIVPGGVASREEVAHRVKADPVVAEHYASFNVAKTHAVQVRAPRAVYVSYRKGGKVYWTSKKVMLVAGETVLSDGSSEIRGRCGNRISDTARLPVALNEPSADELDAGVVGVPGLDDDAGLQNASFAFGDVLPAGSATSFQRLPTFPHGDAAPVDPGKRGGMPSVPFFPMNGMGLQPTRYLTVSSDPASTFPSPSSGDTPASVTPAPTPTPSVPNVPSTPPAQVNPPAAPSVPALPAVPALPDLPGVPAVPVPPSAPPGPDGAPTPVTPVPPAGTAPAPSVPPVPNAPIVPPKPQGEIPEPGTLSLVGAALAALMLSTRRRARRTLPAD